MLSYPNLKARYSKGTLKLSKKLKLPEGTEVYISVRPIKSKTRKRRAARQVGGSQKSGTYPTVRLKPGTLGELAGIMAIGGDALKDSEALYEDV